MRKSIVLPLRLRFLLALALVCACVAGRAQAQFTTGVPAQAQMPDVVGLTSEQAATRLRRLGLSVQTRDVPSTQARGTVTAQSPQAGAGVKRGQAATLDVSTGQGREQTQTGGTTTDGGADGQARPPRAAQVPDLTGMSRTAAQLRLVVSGLVLGEVDSAWVEGARGGRVVAQDPQPGAQAVRGGRVRVTLASRTPPGGRPDPPPQPQPQPDPQPEPRQPAPELVAVPDLAGMTPERARVAVGRARLLLGGVDSARARSTAPGTVLAQRPAAGERVRPGSFVSITLAQSLRVAMPSLVGRPVADARRALGEAGLRAGGVTERESRGAAGRVLTQSIPAGTQVSPGTAVDLAVSRIPAARTDTARRDTVRRDTLPRDTARQDTAAPQRPDTLVSTTPPAQTPVDTAPTPVVVNGQPAGTPTGAREETPARRPARQTGAPARSDVPREVLWGAIALLVLAAGAVLYRLSRRGARPPVRATPVSPAPVSCAVRLSVAGGEWESTTETEAAGPPLGGKLRLSVNVGQPMAMAQPAGADADAAALGPTRVAVRVGDGAAGAGTMVVMDDGAPALSGAGVQVQVRDGAPTFTVDDDKPILLGRR